MRCTACLRLAPRNSVTYGSRSYAGALVLQPQAASNSTTRQFLPYRSRPFLSHPALIASRRRYSRFSTSPEDAEQTEPVSPFKRQRLTQLTEDQESEDPLWEDSHPRLPDNDKRISISKFHQLFHDVIPSETITLSGRVRSKRVVGKGLIFIDIVNEFEKAQIMINKKNIEIDPDSRSRKFDLFRHLIQVGDHISVSGIAARTPAGEPTLDVREMPQLLSPTMQQIPEKLTDQKSRMQDRHVDMLVNREAVDILRLRSEITKYMRDHLHSKRFLEFQTPILAENAGGAVARPFITKASEFKNKDLAMRIAPELWLKRLVIGGVDKVFEIGPAFRNEGIDQTHNPEFTMCEFYSAFTNLNDLIKETEEIICGMAQHCQDAISTQLSSLSPIDLSRYVRPFKQVEFVPGLEQAMGIRLPKLTSDDALPEVLAVLKLAGIRIPGEAPTALHKLLDRLAAIYLEPTSFKEPVFITHHPACMSPLAKGFLCRKTYQLVSARAELFIGGREIANMYEEENDPAEQKRKLNAHRSLVNKPDGQVGIDESIDPNQDEIPPETDEDCAPLDHSFVKALDYGLPPTGGWGCGIERLVMLFSGANRISDCLSFGTLQHVVGLSADDKKP